MSEIEDGVKTIHRSDYNFDEVSDSIRDTILKFSQFDKKQVNAARKNAAKVLFPQPFSVQITLSPSVNS